MKVLRVTDWESLYETAESRRISDLSWVATPNGHNSVLYCQLLRHPNGMAHFGVWNLILQVASKCSIRGLLTYGGDKCPRPHTATTIADVTRGSEKVISECLPRLLEIGWLEEVEMDGDEYQALAHRKPGRAQPRAGQPTNTGQDKTRQDRQDKTDKDSPARAGRSRPLGADPSTPLTREALADWGARLAKGGDDLFPEWVEVCDGLRVDQVAWLFEKHHRECRGKLLWPSQFKKYRKERTA